MIAFFRECYHGLVRQLITRIDDDLHARLKEKAKAEGRSMNAIVTEALGEAVGNPSEREEFFGRLERMGWTIVRPARPVDAPTDEELEELGRGVGTAVSEALQEDRNARW